MWKPFAKYFIATFPLSPCSWMIDSSRSSSQSSSSSVVSINPRAESISAFLQGNCGYGFSLSPSQLTKICNVYIYMHAYAYHYVSKSTRKSMRICLYLRYKRILKISIYVYTWICVQISTAELLFDINTETNMPLTIPNHSARYVQTKFKWNPTSKHFTPGTRTNRNWLPFYGAATPHA